MEVSEPEGEKRAILSITHVHANTSEREQTDLLSEWIMTDGAGS